MRFMQRHKTTLLAGKKVKEMVLGKTILNSEFWSLATLTFLSFEFKIQNSEFKIAES